MPAQEDAQLMLRFQRDGDRAALARLFERNRRALLRFLTRLSRNRTVAEDVAQQTWLKVIDVARQGAFAAASDVPSGPGCVASTLAAAQSLHRRVPAQVCTLPQRAAAG